MQKDIQVFIEAFSEQKIGKNIARKPVFFSRVQIKPFSDITEVI